MDTIKPDAAPDNLRADAAPDNLRADAAPDNLRADAAPRQREAAVLTGRLRAVEADRDAWRRRAEQAQQDRVRQQQRLRTLERSGSYRLGRAVVSLVRNPVRSSPALLRTAIRRMVPAALRRRAGGPVAAPRKKAAAAKRIAVHVYVALGFDDAGLRALVRAAAQCAQVTLDHTPVVVTDNASFSLLRNLGVVFEYVPDRSTWERHLDGADWDAFLADRMAQVFRAHHSDRTIVVDPTDPPGLASLLVLNAAG
jgi:hypothetical protein